MDKVYIGREYRFPEPVPGNDQTCQATMRLRNAKAAAVRLLGWRVSLFVVHETDFNKFNTRRATYVCKIVGFNG